MRFPTICLPLKRQGSVGVRCDVRRGRMQENASKAGQGIIFRSVVYPKTAVAIPIGLHPAELFNMSFCERKRDWRFGLYEGLNPRKSRIERFLFHQTVGRVKLMRDLGMWKVKHRIGPPWVPVGVRLASLSQRICCESRFERL